MRRKRTGVIGALLDEYEVVVRDLQLHIEDVTPSELTAIADAKTRNKDCVSIQSVLTHVVQCGYNDVTMIDIHRGNAKSPWPKRIRYKSVAEYSSALDRMFEDTVQFLSGTK